MCASKWVEAKSIIVVSYTWQTLCLRNVLLLLCFISLLVQIIKSTNYNSDANNLEAVNKSGNFEITDDSTVSLLSYFFLFQIALPKILEINVLRDFLRIFLGSLFKLSFYLNVPR